MSMYKVKPVCSDIKIDLPTCMYKLPNIHTRNSCSPDHALQNGDLDPAVKASEARQDEIMRKSYESKAAVEGLAKTVTTPDADSDVTVGGSLSPQSSSCAIFKATKNSDALSGKDLGALRDIVINANPAQPPLTSSVLHNSSCQHYRVLSTVHVHSSVSNVPPQLSSCLGPKHADSYARHMFQSGFTLIWKDVPKSEMKFSVRSMCPIEGEANVARFLFKLLAPYPSDPASATSVDSWVDTAFYQSAAGSTKERAAVSRALNSASGRGPWSSGPEFSSADIACYCCLLQNGSSSSTAANVQRWIKSCENLGHFGPAKLLLK